jgi:hypothetical protein
MYQRYAAKLPAEQEEVVQPVLKLPQVLPQSWLPVQMRAGQAVVVLLRTRDISLVYCQVQNTFTHKASQSKQAMLAGRNAMVKGHGL